MLELWREGHQVVFGVRRSLQDAWAVAKLRRLFYWFIDVMSEDELPRNAGEFQLVDRRILDELKQVDTTIPICAG